MSRFSEIINDFMYETISDETALAIEDVLKSEAPGDYNVIVRRGHFELVFNTEEAQTLFFLAML